MSSLMGTVPVALGGFIFQKPWYEAEMDLRAQEIILLLFVVKGSSFDREQRYETLTFL
jgi:hypothetical protein